ncbi:DciA family protein [Pseudoxanthomonas wuyuanensis]
MSDPKSRTRRPASTPQPALQAAMSDAATDPVRRALWLDALEQQLRPCLPPALSQHCRLANVADGRRLVFIVDSPVWRAKLRLAAPELINAAQSIGLKVTEVTIKTTTAPPSPAQPAQRAVNPLSETARKALSAALASLDDSISAEPDTTPDYRHGGRKR